LPGNAPDPVPVAQGVQCAILEQARRAVRRLLAGHEVFAETKSPVFAEVGIYRKPCARSQAGLGNASQFRKSLDGIRPSLDDVQTLQANEADELGWLHAGFVAAHP
jgi:hypothetical protein